MAYQYSITPLTGDGSRVRSDHYVVNSPIPNRIGSLAFGRFAFGNEKWISPAGATEEAAADIWLHVLSVDGVPLEGWIAAKHGGVHFARIDEIGTGEEPETPQASGNLSVTVEGESFAEWMIVNISVSSPGFGSRSLSITLPRE